MHGDPPLKLVQRKQKDYKVQPEPRPGGRQTCSVLCSPLPSITRLRTPSLWLLLHRVEPVSLWNSLETTAVFRAGRPETWLAYGKGELYIFTAFMACFCSPNGNTLGAHLQPTAQPCPEQTTHCWGPGPGPPLLSHSPGRPSQPRPPEAATHQDCLPESCLRCCFAFGF